MRGSENLIMMTRWMVLGTFCLWTTATMAQLPPRPANLTARARPGVSPAGKPAEESRPRVKKSRRRPLPGDIVPVQYETPHPDPNSEGPIAEQEAVPTKKSNSIDNPLQALLDRDVTPIDLYSAFRLAGIQNPEILAAQQRVVEAVALRQLAAAQFLPTLNYGGSIDSHRGELQQSSGNILKVNRDAAFIGAGANAIVAGTVNIPGVLWNLNASEAIYNYLASQKQVEKTQFETQSVELDTLLTVAMAYTDLIRAYGTRSVLAQIRDDARELARITAAYAQAGEGSQADADRASTELYRREAAVIQADGATMSASANLCRVLHLDPSTRLEPSDSHVLLQSFVPEPIPLPELLAIALMHRPELNSRRAAIAQALINLDSAKALPFSPTLFLGFSAGDFGGGSNIASQPVGSQFFARGQSRFGNFAARQDLDVMAYWTLRNLGVGNRAMIEATASRLRSADLERLVMLDKVRSEVASASARTHARFARIESCELAVRSGTESLREDMTRIAGREGRPLEAVDSLRLLAKARQEYLNSILEYNEAQFQLYVSLGRPPSEVLIRPAEFVDSGPPEPASAFEESRP